MVDGAGEVDVVVVGAIVVGVGTIDVVVTDVVVVERVGLHVASTK